MRFIFITLGSFLISTSLMAGGLKLKSSVMKKNSILTNDQVFNSFGCSGKNISPDLQWSGEPQGTNFYAITMYDPDAPTGSGWWHWVAFNIPANVKQLAAGAGSEGGVMPVGSIQSRTDFGKPGYGGPCPPPGKAHRYIFTVYALKGPIDLKADASAAMVSFYLRQNALDKDTLTTKYKR